MVNKIYRIPYRVSDDTETWLVAQPNRVGPIRLGDNFTEITYNHDAAQTSAFLKEWSKRGMMSVDTVPENCNKYDDQLYSTTNPPPVSGGQSNETTVLKTSDQTLIGTSYTSITGLNIPLIAFATYEFEFNIIADADAVTTGIDLAITVPSGTTVTYTQRLFSSATAQIVRPAITLDSNSASTGSAGATRAIYTVKGVVIVGVNAGDLIPRIKREAVGTGPNVRTGSWGRARRISS